MFNHSPIQTKESGQFIKIIKKSEETIMFKRDVLYYENRIQLLSSKDA